MREIPAQEILANAWIVIPAWREAQVLGGVIAQLRGICPHILVVDDGSKDDTGAVALAAGATLLTHIVNLGQGAALQTGIEYALRKGAGYIFTFDADGQHAPESLAVLAATMDATGADVVLGSRWLGRVESMPALRRLMLRLAVVFTRVHSGLNLTDTHNGLRLLTRAGAMGIQITQHRMAHASEILAQIGTSRLRYAEAPVTVRYTEYSLRKGQKLSGMFRVLLDIFYARWTQ
ncbi:MAG TPA: glycosyltransferase family 2 protein [Bryobacteraceae bacterium]|jgi:glycosyltransferase involved in cell wall biosynthesis|nr:glycosyltransferase family 2 protein [Bryobacteraceae bacterium]